jgi:hypothetical protein
MAAESREGKRATRGMPGGSGGDDRPDGGSGVDGPRDSYTDGELYRGQQQGVGEGVTPASTRLRRIMQQQSRAQGGQAAAVH